MRVKCDADLITGAKSLYYKNLYIFGLRGWL